jgi:Flp pilus assembly protein TadG
MISRPDSKARSGFMSVKAVAVLPSLIIFAWLGAEFGLLFRWADQAKTAADAVSLAAAARYRDGNQAARADAFAAAAAARAPSGAVTLQIDDGAGGGGDVEFGHWDESTRTFVRDPDGGSAVRVTVRFGPDHPNGAPTLVFGNFFAGSAASLSRSSVAVHNPPAYLTSALVLANVPGAVEMLGNAAFESIGGLAVSSASGSAVVVRDGGSIDAAVLRLAGMLDATGSGAVGYRVREGVQVPVDPFADVSLAEPDPAAAVEIQHVDAGLTHVAPGVHAALQMLGGRVVLLPGLHQFVGGIQLSGDAVLELSGATVQLVGGAGLEVLEQSAIIGQAGDALSAWPGFWLLQRPGGGVWSVADTAEVAVEGLAYGPAGGLQVSNSARWRCEALVIGSLRLRQQGEVFLDGDIAAIAEPVVPGRAKLVR